MAKHQSPTLDKIECPNCGKLIPISDALQHQLTERVKQEMQKQIVEREKEVTARLKELEKREIALSKTEKNIDHEVQERLKQERVKLGQEALKKAQEELGVELQDTKNQLKEKNQKLAEAHAMELGLRKQARELEERSKTLDLEAARKVDAARAKIQEETSKRVTEEYRLKDMEREKQISDMRRQIEDLKRKAEQGSQQLQGEVQELDLEEFLKTNFPYDEIQPVAKGERGADIFQKVHTPRGNLCGAILWESKRTKNWNEGWIIKLKDDQREAKADLAVFVTETLPKDIPNFGPRNGVWLTKPAFVLGVATLLRSSLMRVAQIKIAAESKDEKMEVLFSYLTGPEFTQRVQAAAETFNNMKQDLDKEKRLTITRWAKREKDMERVIAAIAGMHGDLQGLIGPSMQPIPALESGEDEEVETKDSTNEDENENESSGEEGVDPKDVPF